MRISLGALSAVLLAAGSFSSLLVPRVALSAQAPAQVTFSRDIAPIVFAQCAACHRPGEVGPFSLLTYTDVKQHARQIAEVTRRRVMPPWKVESAPGTKDATLLRAFIHAAREAGARVAAEHPADHPAPGTDADVRPFDWQEEL